LRCGEFLVAHLLLERFNFTLNGFINDLAFQNEYFAVLHHARVSETFSKHLLRPLARALVVIENIMCQSILQQRRKQLPVFTKVCKLLIDEIHCRLDGKKRIDILSSEILFRTILITPSSGKFSALVRMIPLA
jgi:hypothetical protein